VRDKLSKLTIFFNADQTTGKNGDIMFTSYYNKTHHEFKLIKLKIMWKHFYYQIVS